MIKKMILFLSVVVSTGYSEYCQSCQSSPCGFYGRKVESCRTGPLLRSFGEAFNWRNCVDGRCPSDLPCSNWIDGMDASGGRMWDPIPRLTKTQCLEKCSETQGCIGAVLVARRNADYKDPDVIGLCHRSSNFSVGNARSNSRTKHKFTGFLNTCREPLGIIEPDVVDTLISLVEFGGDIFQQIVGSPSTTSTVRPPTTTAKYEDDLSEQGNKNLQDIYKICGKVERQPSPELIVTHSTEDIAAPWIVSLGVYQGAVYYHQCGGSLVTYQHVLTAGHCIATSLFNTGTWVARLGEYHYQASHIYCIEFFSGDRNLASNEDNLSVREVGIKKAVVNPNFRKTRGKDDESLYFDIGIVVLQSKVSPDLGFIPICLPRISLKNPSSLTNQALTIIGYGLNNKDEIGADLLLETVAIRETEYCNTAHMVAAGEDRERVESALPELFISSLFCADQDLDKKVGPCHGDSGSPAFQRIFSEGDRFVVQGVVSGTIQCSSDRYPNFFTLVASQDILPWVKKQVFDSQQSDVGYEFPDEDFSNIPCFDDIDCPSDHGFTCSSSTGVCLRPSSTAALYIAAASRKCSDDYPCQIRGSCTKPHCNKLGVCWCSEFQATSSDPQSSQKQNMNNSPQNVSQNIYTFLPPSTSDWMISCNNKEDCPRDWFCSGRCFPPSSNPSGSADKSLYVPVVSGTSHFTKTCHHCNIGLACPDILPCWDGAQCSLPVCSRVAGDSKCWCDLFSTNIKKTGGCLAVRECSAIQHQVWWARRLGMQARNKQFRKIQQFIKQRECTTHQQRKGVRC